MITIFLFNLTKACAGRLRPNFVATCQPNISWDDCKPGEFIQNYVCNGPSKHRATESRLSFYSGHTAESFYYAVFLIVRRLFLREKIPTLAAPHKKSFPVGFVFFSSDIPTYFLPYLSNLFYKLRRFSSLI